MRAENVLVTGATGKVGRELVPLLLERGVTVMAGTRDPGRARVLFGSGVEVVELNYHRTETYDAALTWADRVFLVPPPFTPRAYDAIGAFLDWAVSARVGHIVLLSGMTVPEVEELDLRKAERHLEAQDTRHTILRPNLYMQNFFPGFISRQVVGDNRVRLPAGQGEVSLVDVRDVAAVAARCLGGEACHGRALTLTGPRAMTMEEAVTILSEGAGVELAFEAVTDEEFRSLLEAEGWREGEIEVVLGLFSSLRAGHRAPVHTDVEEILGRPPRTFEAFARELEGTWV